MRCVWIQFHTPLFFLEFSQISVGEDILSPQSINDGQSVGSRTVTQLYTPKNLLPQSQLRQGRGEENYSLTVHFFSQPEPFGSSFFFFLAWEVARGLQFAGKCVVNSAEHWTCRWWQTVSPAGQQVFPHSAKMNCNSPRDSVPCLMWKWQLVLGFDGSGSPWCHLPASKPSVNHSNCPPRSRLKIPVTQEASEF